MKTDEEPVSIMTKAGELYVQSGAKLWFVSLSFDISDFDGDKERKQPAMALCRG